MIDTAHIIITVAVHTVMIQVAAGITTEFFIAAAMKPFPAYGTIPGECDHSNGLITKIKSC
jgi:hypothetical protein